MNMGRVERVPTANYKDCTYDELFLDDLTSVKLAMGICGGVWCGLSHGEEPTLTLLALRME